MCRHLVNEYMVPDIQLRLLDVRLPTFNITYCTSGSRHLILLNIKFNITARRVPDVVLSSYTSGSRHLMLFIARRVPDV